MRARRSQQAFFGFVAGAIVVALLTVTPAGAHITRGVKHTGKHMRKLFYTKAESDGRYLSQAQADAAYLTPAAGDARYLAATGQVRVNASPMDWVKINPAITAVPEAKPSVGATTFGGSSGAATDVPFAISPTLPTMLAGRTLRLVGVNACFATDAITTLTTVRVHVTRNTSGPGSTTTPFIDPTDRGPNVDACETFTLASPLAITPDDDVTLQFDVNYSANAGFFSAGRATFILTMA